MVTPSATGVSPEAEAAAAGRTLLLLGWVLMQVAPGAAAGHTNLVVAYNLTWKSTNFKTVLEWKPKPSNQVYSVQISSSLGNWTTKCHLIEVTKCDVSEEIAKDVNQTYVARVLSYPPHTNDTSEGVPSANSSDFMPYLDTHLGRPSIMSYGHVGVKLNVTVKHIHTLVKRNNTFLNLQEVFGNDLCYELHYWRPSSTGRKVAKTKTNEFLVDVDEDYCFRVQAVIPSRKTNQKSPEGFIECIGLRKTGSRDLLSFLGPVLFVIIVIVSSVALYKCNQRKPMKPKESSASTV